MRKLVGQLIVLSRNIWLRKPTDEPSFSAQFPVGKRKGFGFPSGIALTWWYTNRSFRASEAVASLIVESLERFKHCDIETVRQALSDTLQEICVDQHIFTPDDVCFMRRPTLFDCRTIKNPAEFGSAVLKAVFDNLDAQITARCTLYVAPRIKGPTFHIASQNITALHRADLAGWSAILERGYSANGWAPATGKCARGDDPGFSKLRYDYVFVCEESGTQKGAAFLCGLKLRRLFAVIFAVLSEGRTAPLTKSSADPYRISLQFSGPPSPDGVITSSNLGELLPYYIDDHEISSGHVSSIQAWFESVSHLCSEKAQRIEKGAHFINKAMNSDDIESYVSYFVALDAFFGKRGSVEASILSGVESIGLDTSMLEKASWLFDLRNELVHGGSRYVKEWPKYRRYYRHFNSRPELDLEKLAFAALRRTPVSFESA